MDLFMLLACMKLACLNRSYIFGSRSFSHLCAAVNCPTTTLSNSQTSSLVGTTTAAIATTCANGYSIGGGASVTTTQTYTCAATGLAASAWTPSPATTFCQGNVEKYI